MRFKIIFLVFLLISLVIVNAAVEDFVKDGTKKAICKSEEGSAACQAYGALNDPTGKLLNELGPQAMQFFSGVKDPLGTGRSIVMEKLIASLPPEEQSAIQFYNNFHGYLEKINDFFSKDEANKYEADYEDGNAIIKKDGEPYFVVSPGIVIPEDNNKITGGVVTDTKNVKEPIELKTSEDKPKIPFVCSANSCKKIKANGFEVFNLKKDDSIEFEEDPNTGIKKFRIIKGNLELKINGKPMGIIKNGEFRTKKKDKIEYIEYAKFDSVSGGKYTFNYNNLDYNFDVGKNGFVLFDPKNVIKGKAPLKIDYPKIGKKEAYSYKIEGDYSIITKNGIPSYIDYSKNGKFCDNLKCDNLEASSKEMFTLCIGEDSFKNICPKKTNSLGYKIDKEGFEIYNSKGLIDYKVKETNINGKKESETQLAVDNKKKGISLNIVKSGNGVKFIQSGRGFEIDNKGNLNVYAGSFSTKYKSGKDFLVSSGGVIIHMTKSGICDITAGKNKVSCINDGLLNLVVPTNKNIRAEQQKNILDNYIRSNKAEETKLLGASPETEKLGLGDYVNVVGTFVDCKSRIKMKCQERAEDLNKLNEALQIVRDDIYKGIDPKKAVEKLKGFKDTDYSKEYEIINSRILPVLTNAVNKDGTINIDYLNDKEIKKLSKEKECGITGFVKGCTNTNEKIMHAYYNKEIHNTLSNTPIIEKGVIIDPVNSNLYREVYSSIEDYKDYNQIALNKLKQPQERTAGYETKLTSGAEPGMKKLNVQRIEPVKETPSAFIDFMKEFKKLDDSSQAGINPKPFVIVNGEVKFYYDMEDSINSEVSRLNNINNANPKLFGQMDTAWQGAYVQETGTVELISEFLSPADIVLSATVVGGGIRVLERTSKGVLKLTDLAKTGKVLEVMKAAKGDRIIGDMAEGLIKCYSPCTWKDVKILLEKARIKKEDIEGFKKILNVNDADKISNLDNLNVLLRPTNRDNILAAINNANTQGEIESIKNVLEQLQENIAKGRGIKTSDLDVNGQLNFIKGALNKVDGKIIQLAPSIKGLPREPLLYANTEFIKSTKYTHTEKRIYEIYEPKTNKLLGTTDDISYIDTKGSISSIPQDESLYSKSLNTLYGGKINTQNDVRIIFYSKGGPSGPKSVAIRSKTGAGQLIDLNYFPNKYGELISLLDKYGVKARYLGEARVRGVKANKIQINNIIFNFDKQGNVILREIIEIPKK